MNFTILALTPTLGNFILKILDTYSKKDGILLMHLSFRLPSCFNHFLIFPQNFNICNDFTSQSPFSPFHNAYRFLHKSKIVFDLKGFIADYVLWVRQSAHTYGGWKAEIPHICIERGR